MSNGALSSWQRALQNIREGKTQGSISAEQRALQDVMRGNVSGAMSGLQERAKLFLSTGFEVPLEVSSSQVEVINQKGEVIGTVNERPMAGNIGATFPTSGGGTYEQIGEPVVISRKTIDINTGKEIQSQGSLKITPQNKETIVTSGKDFVSRIPKSEIMNNRVDVVDVIRKTPITQIKKQENPQTFEEYIGNVVGTETYLGNQLQKTEKGFLFGDFANREILITPEKQKYEIVRDPEQRESLFLYPIMPESEFQESKKREDVKSFISSREGTIATAPLALGSLFGQIGGATMSLVTGDFAGAKNYLSGAYTENLLSDFVYSAKYGKRDKSLEEFITTAGIPIGESALVVGSLGYGSGAVANVGKLARGSITALQVGATIREPSPLNIALSGFTLAPHIPVKAGRIKIPTAEGEATVYTGLRYEFGMSPKNILGKTFEIPSTSKSLVGMSGGKIIFGTPKAEQLLNLEKFAPSGRGFSIMSPQQTEIFLERETLLKLGLPEKEIPKLQVGKDILYEVGTGNEKFLMEQFAKESKILKPEEVTAFVQYAKGKGKKYIEKVFGSFPQQSEVLPEFKRKFGDIDIFAKDEAGASIMSKEISSELRNVFGREFEAVGTKIKLGKEKVLEIHYGGEKPDASMSWISGDYEGVLGLKKDFPIRKLEGVKVTSGVEQLRRKLGSAISIQDVGSEGGGFAGKRVSPPIFRMKDVSDFYGLAKTQAFLIGGKKGSMISSLAERFKSMFPEAEFPKGDLKTELPITKDLSGFSMRTTKPSLFDLRYQKPSYSSRDKISESKISSSKIAQKRESFVSSYKPKSIERPSIKSILSVEKTSYSPIRESLKPSYPKESKISTSIPSEFPSIYPPPSKTPKYPPSIIPKYPKSPPPSYIYKIIPKPPVTPPSGFKMSSELSKEFQGYDIFVKRRGKYSKRNIRPLSRSEAIRFGQREVDISPSQSFQIRPSGRIRGIETRLPDMSKLRMPIRKGFKIPRIGGLETFIEKRKFAIDTKGEYEGITEKGLFARMNSGISKNIFGSIFRKRKSRRRK